MKYTRLDSYVFLLSPILASLADLHPATLGLSRNKTKSLVTRRLETFKISKLIVLKTRYLRVNVVYRKKISERGCLTKPFENTYSVHSPAPAFFPTLHIRCWGMIDIFGSRLHGIEFS